MSDYNVRIKPGILAILDQSKQLKEYSFDGQNYRLVGEKMITVPEIVAEGWIAHDTDLEIVYPDAM
jgi:hypothetical protein